MIVEYCQLLSSAHHVIDGEFAIGGIYKKTHVNHPSAVWARTSSQHYEWVWFCAMQLCENYEKLTGKKHKTEQTLCVLADFPIGLSDLGFCHPPVAAPDEFKALAVLLKDTCRAYQLYLIEKFQEWQSREKPIKVDFFLKPEWI